MTGFWDGGGYSWTLCKQPAPHSRQTTTPTPHHSMFTGRMRFLMPSQQSQSTEGHTCASSLVLKYTNDIKSVRIHDAARSTTGWTRRFVYSFNQTRHNVYCPHSRLAARVDLVTSYAGPLKRRLAALICIVHPTRC